MKLVFERPRKDILYYLLDCVKNGDERYNIFKLYNEIEKEPHDQVFKEIKGFNNLSEKLQGLFIQAAIEYATAQSGDSAANQKISHVEQNQDDVRIWGTTALRMYLTHSCNSEPYSGYQLCVNGNYGG